MQNFDLAIAIQPNVAIGYITKGDCFKESGELTEAIKIYTHALTKEINNNKIALLKRGITYLELKDLSSALKDLY